MSYYGLKKNGLNGTKLKKFLVIKFIYLLKIFDIKVPKLPHTEYLL